MGVDNKRIAKNTVFIYIRMIIVVFVSLFSVRVIFQVLGNTDYGVYNVVAGFVSMLTIISTTLRLAINRFLAYSIGEGDKEKITNVLNQSLICFIGIAAILLVFFETIGLWFVSNKLVIPPERVTAAIWVYQFSVVSFISTILAVPFGALMVAYEDISFYSLLNIAEAIAKLAIIYLVKYSHADKLIHYGLYLLLVVFVKELVCYAYCRIKYDTCRFRLVWDKKIFTSLFSFAGWTMYGATANVANNQGNNILTNLYFGPDVNADRSVAFQVSNALSMFGTHLFTAFKPPLVKSYAQGDYNQANRLFTLSSKFSFYLCLILFLPLFFETRLLLNLWLDTPTENMYLFTRLTLIYSIILTQGEPITTLIQATGKIKVYHLIIETITLLSLPLTLFFFGLGFNPEASFYITIAVFLVAHVFRVVVLVRTVSFFDSKLYVRNFLIRSFLVAMIAFVIAFVLYKAIQPGVLRFLILCLVSVSSVVPLSYFIGMDEGERNSFKRLLSDFLSRNKKSHIR